MTGCTDFAVGEMSFLDVKMADNSMAPLSPVKDQWDLTSGKPCAGEITASPGKGNGDVGSFFISHNGGV